jgi:hypothetical protein
LKEFKKSEFQKKIKKTFFTGTSGELWEIWGTLGELSIWGILTGVPGGTWPGEPIGAWDRAPPLRN